MQRITITVDDELVTALDDVIATSGYQNRSEAIRDLTRAGIAQVQERTNDAQAGVAALVYVYDHGARDLAKRLESGKFVWPPIVDGKMVLTPAQLTLLIEAMDWRRTVAADVPRRPVAVG